MNSHIDMPSTVHRIKKQSIKKKLDGKLDIKIIFNEKVISNNYYLNLNYDIIYLRTKM